MKTTGQKFVGIYPDGDAMRDALPRLEPGDCVMYRGWPHEVVDAGEQGHRVAAFRRPLDAQQRKEAEQPVQPVHFGGPPTILDYGHPRSSRVAEPTTRVGQWFSYGKGPTQWHGPIVSSYGGHHYGDNRWKPGPASFSLSEARITDGTYVRIPPKLDGMDAEEFRVPVKGESHYDLIGGLVVFDSEEGPASMPDFGRRRWIYKAAKKPWPVGPYEIVYDEMQSELLSILNGASQKLAGDMSDSTAEAIALAMNWLPRAAAFIRKLILGEFVEEQAALLAELDGWEMPK